MGIAWVRTVGPQDAEGEILSAYQEMTGESEPAEIRRRIRKNFVAMSIRPRQMEALWRLAHTVSFRNEDSGLSKAEDDMIDTVVSVANRCRY